MAEKAAEEGKKKKGSKLPLIIGIVALAGGGGFFAAKGQGGKKPVEKKVELGEIESLGEFLVNLSDGRTFLRAEISVHVAKGEHLDPHAGGGDGHGGGEAAPPAPIRDAVIEVLTSQSLGGVTSVAGKARLKKQLAHAINEAAHDLHPPEPGKDKKDGEEKKEGEKKEKADHGHKEWDSAEGPVLKVYFTSFATQQ